MRIDILTIFPNVISSVIGESVLKKAQEKNLAEFKIWDIREFATDKHKTVDDTPFGGGGGMVMKVEPLTVALEKVLSQIQGKRKIILTSASGRKFDQKLAQEYSLGRAALRRRDRRSGHQGLRPGLSPDGGRHADAGPRALRPSLDRLEAADRHDRRR